MAKLFLLYVKVWSRIQNRVVAAKPFENISAVELLFAISLSEEMPRYSVLGCIVKDSGPDKEEERK
jgi:hypothetical protein